jgi:hypothetical protein
MKIKRIVLAVLITACSKQPASAPAGASTAPAAAPSGGKLKVAIVAQLGTQRGMGESCGTD